MDAYFNESNLDYAEVPKPLPSWSAFILGGIVSFLLVYIGVARPLANELSLLRNQVGSLQASVVEVAGKHDSASEATSLLETLAKQEQTLETARQSVAELQQLQRQLLAEARQTQDAMTAIAELAALKDTLLANSDRTEAAVDVMATAELICDRLASAADSSYLALEAGNNLLALREELVDRGRDVTTANTALDALVDIRDTLENEKESFAVASQRVVDLLSLKDTVVNQTDDLADAIANIELTSELNRQFQEAMMAFNDMKHWMIEVVASEPIMQRAKLALQPITELGNLRRVSPDRLREIARSVSQQYQTRVASKPADSEAILISEEDTDNEPSLGETEMLAPLTTN